MSQQKVDRYKEEKKNREKTKRRKKIKQTIAIFLAAIALGAMIGVPLGRKIYKENKKKEDAKAAEAAKYVSADDLNSWLDSYWVENYSDLYTGITFATSTDAE
ncbi:MAG: hypothetical protein IJJ74_11450 [Eubacterium sp.]|nr:hypothetical protein [Eubacterium sp.]MBR1673364.1 hypothetical protein [Eubacterium sp.]